MKNILFITWDGPQTNYMEGLFLPLFNEIQKKYGYRVHIIQFTWSTKEQIAKQKQNAEELSISYTGKSINRKPFVQFGSIISLYEGTQFLKNYIEIKNIDIVIPRSTMPALMVNRIKNRNFKLLFDADGLPLEERVDFSKLSPQSLHYLLLKKEETKMLINADRVITRSKKAIKIHLSTIGNINPEKFSVVINGRNPDFFKPNTIARSQVRKELNATDNTKIFVYCGSLGPQYCWEEMMLLFEKMHQKNSDSLFLILTGNIAFALERIPEEIKNNIVVKNIDFKEIPKYLAAADIAFALRKPTYSMTAVAPIKLGEYLLMGIPTIASKGIGDSNELIKKIPSCFLFNHNSSSSIDKAINFIENVDNSFQKEIRNYGKEYFSIEESALTYVKSLNLL